MSTPNVVGEVLGALSPHAFCARYRIGLSKFYQEVAAGRLAVKKAGRATLISVAEAERWLRSLPEGATSKAPPRKRSAA